MVWALICVGLFTAALVVLGLCYPEKGEWLDELFLCLAIFATLASSSMKLVVMVDASASADMVRRVEVFFSWPVFAAVWAPYLGLKFGRVLGRQINKWAENAKEIFP